MTVCSEIRKPEAANNEWLKYCGWRLQGNVETELIHVDIGAAEVFGRVVLNYVLFDRSGLMIELELRLKARQQRVIGDDSIIPTVFYREVVDGTGVQVNRAAETHASKGSEF